MVEKHVVNNKRWSLANSHLGREAVSPGSQETEFFQQACQVRVRSFPSEPSDENPTLADSITAWETLGSTEPVKLCPDS